MTAIENRGPAPGWLLTVEDPLGRARHLLGEKGSRDRAAANQAEQVLGQISDALGAFLAEFGVETPLGWRLHQLRSDLDAHLLAASAFADADAPDAVVNVLRRSLDLVAAELHALAGAAQPT